MLLTRRGHPATIPTTRVIRGATSLDIEEATTVITMGVDSIITSTIKDRVPQHGLKAVSHY